MATGIKQIDALRLLAGTPVQLTDKITFRQPTLQNVIDAGEESYYAGLSNLTAIPSDMKSFLWDRGIDWMNIKDIELFASLCKAVPYSITSMFFPDIHFSDFILIRQGNDDLLMYDSKTDTRIDNYVYAKIQSCLCQSHGIKKKVEKAGNIHTKKILVEEDRENRLRNKDKPFKSNLLNLVSSMVNYAGFKYNYDTVWNMTMFQFYDAVKRVNLFESTEHLLNGVYAGTIDGKKISDEKMNWMREIKNEN